MGHSYHRREQYGLTDLSAGRRDSCEEEIVLGVFAGKVGARRENAAGREMVTAGRSEKAQAVPALPSRKKGLRGRRRFGKILLS